jgi:hypothetical protein
MMLADRGSVGGNVRFYTPTECESWLAGRHRLKLESTQGLHRHRLSYPREPHRIYQLAYWVASCLTYRMPALLWITEWGIWESSENWHLYYTLRRSHGDRLLLHEAPGHLFLQHEVEDLASFLQVSMLNGWGGYLLTEANYVNAFFSHDEFVDFFAEDEGSLADVRKLLTNENAPAS